VTANPSPIEPEPAVPALPAVTCSLCGRGETEPAASGWTRQIGDRGRVEWLCARCTRDNLRSIEGRLDSDWW
jgi:hypothetical protein